MPRSGDAHKASDAMRLERARRVRQWSVENLFQLLREKNISRAYVMYENGRFHLSHEALRPIEAFLELSHDFSNHEAVFLAPSPERFRTVFAAFVHDTRRGLAQGGLRLWPYKTVADLLADGLRLSQGMTRKNALAGLDWGGGKGIISLPPYVEKVADYYGNEERKELFSAYGEFVASLDGVYYTAEDVGTVTADMNQLLAANRFTTCIAVDRGGSGNPSAHTAWGVYRAMVAAWEMIGHSKTLQGVTVAVQGAGNVGGPLIQYLHRAGARLIVADVAVAPLDALRKHYPDVTIVPDVHAVQADIFAPCALGNVVNRDTIPRLQQMGVRLVCGAANNQLGEPHDAERLDAAGIAYVPDYLCNRMGITNCADEWMGYLQQDVQLATERVYHDTLRVFRFAEVAEISTARAADRLADVAAAQLHPLMLHRGRRIEDHLRDMHWDTLDLDDRARRASRKWWESESPQVNRKVHFLPRAHEPLLHREAERNGAFSGRGPALAANPISTAGRPHLGRFLSSVLMDVAARARNDEARRIVTLDHGGIALQNAVEASRPYVSRHPGMLDHLRLECADLHARHGAEVRHQLGQAGVGFDAREWLDPMNPDEKEAVHRTYLRLKDLGKVRRAWEQGRVQWRCRACATVVTGDTELVSSRIADYFLTFQTTSGKPVEAQVNRLEYVPFAVAIAVRADEPFADATRGYAIHPAGHQLPIFASAEPMRDGVDAELIVPGSSLDHARFSAEHGLPVQQRIYAAGAVRVHGELKDRKSAARDVASEFNQAIRIVTRDGEVLRCRECEGPVDPDESAQVSLDLAPESKELARLIETGGVTFTTPGAAKTVLGLLKEQKPIYISRQSVWGNDLLDGSEDVLSPFFSMAALSLYAAGWPRNGAPEPIDTVFTTPAFLGRWVVPAQLIALAIYGRPLFRHVVVHGSVHIVERANADANPNETRDEERYLYRTRETSMRLRAGNAIEPATLVQRFGADALRLWYLLALQPGSPRTVLREELGLAARTQVHRLNTVLSFFLDATRGDSGKPQPQVLDSLIVGKVRELAIAARNAYPEHAYERAARAFLEAVEHVARWGRVVAPEDQVRDRSAARVTLVSLVDELQRGFSPMTPFLLGYFAQEVRGWAGDASFHSWADDFIEVLSMKGRPICIGVRDAAIRTEIAANMQQIQEVFDLTFELVDEEPADLDVVVGPFFRKRGRAGA
ncbi:MAG TPA: Glu/Leu/Phe/Val dehydrogenase dimerization domain-containing protein [Thermoanaerobaculia bacterium]|nr:Glu/Leu/Phe/Val dehydrogenase dimerization domain-containing protein [Thermoanaerobaculia bacterium]